MNRYGRSVARGWRRRIGTSPSVAAGPPAAQQRDNLLVGIDMCWRPALVCFAEFCWLQVDYSVNRDVFHARQTAAALRGRIADRTYNAWAASRCSSEPFCRVAANRCRSMTIPRALLTRSADRSFPIPPAQCGMGPRCYQPLSVYCLQWSVPLAVTAEAIGNI